jgi:phage antirepressor YoqD-like protein
MTIYETADALGISRDLVEKRVNELFPNRMRKGMTTYLTEAEVTAVKMRIQQNSSLATSDDHRRLADMPSTDLEMMILDRRVSEWKTRKIKELQKEIATKDEVIAISAPKVESFNALMRSDQTMSITDAAKHFGLHPKAEVFPYLRDRGYLTKYDLPTQAAIDAGYLALREVERRGDGKVIEQACVLAS